MLSDYIHELSVIVDEAKLAFFIRADKLFKAYTHTATDILIGDLMNNNGSREYTDMLDEVYNFIEEGIDFIGSEIGISFVDNASDQDKKLVLETFKLAEDFEDSTTIVRLFESETTVHDRLLEVLAFVSGFNLSVFDDIIEDVEPDNILALYKIHYDRVEEAEALRQIFTKSPELKRIKSFIEQYPRTIVEDGIYNAGFRPGLPLKPLLNTNANAIRAFVGTDNKRVAVEIIGLLLIGNVPNLKLAEMGRIVATRLVDIPIQLSEINTHINLIAGEVSNYG